MIFIEKINERGVILHSAFDKLFDLVIKNQVHPGDLLLVNENGFYNPEFTKNNNFGNEILPYTIGPNNEMYSEQTHFDFIDSYRKTYECQFTYNEYLNKIKWNPEESDNIDKLIFQEGLSIQLEMLIYLKIWESDLFIKRLYQLVRLSSGIEYDWEFKISESNREKNCTGIRNEIIRKKIRDKLKLTIPDLYYSIKKAYKTQVRNSIAHSNYSILDRNILLNNYIEGDVINILISLNFDEWIEIFHETMILYNEYVGFLNKVNSYYVELAKSNNNKIEVKFNMKYQVEKVEYRNMEFRQEWNDFIINQT